MARPQSYAENTALAVVGKPKRIPLPTGKGYRYGGRQKGVTPQHIEMFRNACRGYSMEGLARLITMGRQTADMRLAFDAWKFIIEQGYGKAPQGIQLTGAAGEPLDLGKLTDAQLTLVIARFELAATGEEVVATIEGGSGEAPQESEAASGHDQAAGRDQEHEPEI